MLKKLNLVILLASVAGGVALVAMMRQGSRHGDVVVAGRVIRVYGKDYTLQKLAEKIGDPDILSYDAEAREALALASIVVHGGLRIGHPEQRELGETVILDTVKCGDLKLEVVPGGTLEIYNSRVTTKSEMLTADNCSLGYGFLVDGRFVAADSTFQFMSGTESKVARRNATIQFDRVRFVDCDGSAFQTEDADGERLSIRDSWFLCAGRTGALIVGTGGEPVTFRNCRLRGEESDLAIRGAGAVARLIDCDFKPRKLFFYHRRARVEVLWTLNVRVVQKGTGTPVPGVEVVATGTGPEREEVVATTDAKGTCTLTLTEFVAAAEFPTRQEDGTNSRTPHRIVARRGGAELAAHNAFDARSGGETIVLEIPGD
jgi:hypothetical protein